MTSRAQKTVRIIPRKVIDLALRSLDGTAALLARIGVSPNVVSLFALAAGIAAGYFYAVGKPLEAALFIIFAGAFDILDGKVAKCRNQTSKFGAIFDSTLDRYSEFALYLGLAYYFRDHWALWITFFTFLGSTMVSYTRARAEGLGIDEI